MLTRKGGHISIPLHIARKGPGATIFGDIPLEIFRVQKIRQNSSNSPSFRSLGNIPYIPLILNLQSPFPLQKCCEIWVSCELFSD